MLTRSDNPSSRLVMFPELDGYQSNFHSRWGGCVIILKEVDVLELCPNEQIWPYCGCCGKFLLPPEIHRRTETHGKTVHRALYEQPAEVTRREVSQHLARRERGQERAAELLVAPPPPPSALRLPASALQPPPPPPLDPSVQRLGTQPLAQLGFGFNCAPPPPPP